jgi:hypothetical protein
MSRSYQSIYVPVHRWSFKNFGQGRLPQFKSLFNVSFLLIIILTNAALLTQLLIKSKILAVNEFSATAILLVAIVFMLFNHLILLNNKWLKALNDKMAQLSRRNLNTYSIILLINVIITCGFLLVTAR